MTTPTPDLTENSDDVWTDRGLLSEEIGHALADAIYHDDPVIIVQTLNDDKGPGMVTRRLNPALAMEGRHPTDVGPTHIRAIAAGPCFRLAMDYRFGTIPMAQSLANAVLTLKIVNLFKLCEEDEAAIDAMKPAPATYASAMRFGLLMAFWLRGNISLERLLDRVERDRRMIFDTPKIRSALGDVPQQLDILASERGFWRDETSINSILETLTGYHVPDLVTTLVEPRKS